MIEERRRDRVHPVEQLPRIGAEEQQAVGPREQGIRPEGDEVEQRLGPHEGDHVEAGDRNPEADREQPAPAMANRIGDVREWASDAGEHHPHQRGDRSQRGADEQPQRKQAQRRQHAGIIGHD